MCGLPDVVKNSMFIFSAVLLLISVFFLNQEASNWFVRHAYYWILLAVFMLWLLAMFRYIREQPKRSAFKKKEHLYLIVCALLLLFMQDPSYKMGIEEAELVASSKQMHLEKEYGFAQRGYDLGGAYYEYDIHIDTRPGFFPFLLSLLHDFTGYRSGQGIVLNAFLAFALVYLLALIGRSLWPSSGIWAGPLLALNIPLIPLLANSSSVDLLDGVMLLLVIYLVLDYWKSRNGLMLWPLVWSLMLLVNTRYDSVAYYALGVVVIWHLRKKSWKTALPAAAVFVPWALLPVGLLLKSRVSRDELLPLDAKEGLQTAIQYLNDVWSWMTNFSFNNDGLFPAILLLSIVLLLLKMIWQKCFMQRAECCRVWPTALLLGMLLLHFCVCWAFTFRIPGRSGDAYYAFVPLLFIGLVLLLELFGQLFREKISLYVVFGLLALGVVTQSRSTVLPEKNDDVRRSTAADAANWLKNQAQVYKGQNVLFVVEQTPVAIVEEVSAISMKRAINRKAELALHLELKTFSDIYIIHDHGRASNMDTDFILEPVNTLQSLSGAELQLSRLVQVNSTPLERAQLIEQLDDRDLSMEWFKVVPAILP